MRHALSLSAFVLDGSFRLTTVKAGECRKQCTHTTALVKKPPRSYNEKRRPVQLKTPHAASSSLFPSKRLKNRRLPFPQPTPSTFFICFPSLFASAVPHPVTHSGLRFFIPPIQRRVWVPRISLGKALRLPKATVGNTAHLFPIEKPFCTRCDRANPARTKVEAAVTPFRFPTATLLKPPVGLLHDGRR